jgi:broad specificity phosphatase PhoE
VSTLTLVRHGQASLFSADYDRLSPVGEQQSRALGAYWARHGIVIDHVYCGPRQRHRRSAELAGEDYRTTGRTWPEPQVIEALDEFDMDGLASRFAPQLAEREPEFARLMQEFLQSPAADDRQRAFQRTFEFALRHWQSAESLDGDVETWPAFKARVSSVVDALRGAAGRGTRSVVFTSGGVIGCAVQQALSVSDRTMLELSWRIRNGSLTDFVFTQDRFTLDAFNMIPHLTDPTLWTYA